ncbi:MAG: CoA transferase [Immundisolibacteraceae bacterium]|nr:CoA transferase [Immundisolibacteraceae bacterium]
MAQAILEGYKVLDLSQVVAGPSVTRMMAEMGAEVIKVEIAPLGDLAHQLPYIENGRSAYYVQQNRGKKSLCLDVKSPEGKQILLDLAGKVDVLVEAFSPGAIGRLGLGYEVVSKLNPDLVMCSISAFGQSGPQAQMPGYDYIAQAYSGFTGLIGEADGSPYFPQVAFGDAATGGYALAAVMAALLHRERGGPGQYLDISLLDVYLHGNEIGIQSISASKGKLVPTRTGNQHFSVTPLGIFKGASGYLVIVALGKQWLDLCKVMGQPELGTDQRFIDNPSRVANLPAVIEIIESWLHRTGDDAEAMRQLEAGHVPFAPVLTVQQAMELPQVKHRGSVRTITDRQLGEFKVPMSPLRFSVSGDTPGLPAPFLGEHNQQILEQMLGFTNNQINELTDQGVLQSKPLAD